MNCRSVSIINVDEMMDSEMQGMVGESGMCWTVRQVRHTHTHSCMNCIIGTVGVVSAGSGIVGMDCWYYYQC